MKPVFLYFSVVSTLMIICGTYAGAGELTGDSSTGNAVTGTTTSTAGNNSGVLGVNNGLGKGVLGIGLSGEGVKGESTNGQMGVFGTSSHIGVWGLTSSTADNDSGVLGSNNGAGKGVLGVGTNGEGVKGESTNGQMGVFGTSSHNGVWGLTSSTAANDSGVLGVNNGAGKGVLGISTNGEGVKGESNSAQGSGGTFMNGGGGDLIRAGNQTGILFSVNNSGDVFVRGQKIGAAGAQGPPGPHGPQGPAGPPGPVSRAGCL